MWAFALVAVLHLSIDSVLQLGSFSWAMLVVFVVFVPAQGWHSLERYFAARRTPVVVHYDADSGFALALCRLIKRLDGLGFVTFRPTDDDSPSEAEQTLCVSVNGETTAAGWDALLAIADALWFGRRPLLLLAPLLRRRAARRFSQMATGTEELDLDLGLQHLPAQRDAHAEDASAARVAWRTARHRVGEALVAVLLVVCASQVLIENPAVPRSLKPQGRPALFEAIIAYPRIFQGWAMFAPAPPMSDGRLVIDGRTKDGRHLDPLTGREPAFVVHASGTPRDNLIWGYFHLRIVEDRFRAYWNGVREMVTSHHKLTDRPQDELVSFDAYYVTETFPPPGGQKAPPERRKLFSSSFMPGEATPVPPVRPKGKPSKPRAQ